MESSSFFSAASFLVVKTTDYCNLGCKYCHQDALSGKPVIIPIETYKNAIRLVLKPSQSQMVTVQFHGGEPLLCPDDFFREAVAFAKAELETSLRRVNFCMQTNLTLFSPEKETLFRELNIGVGFSIDGPPQINDVLRGGSRRIIENWRRMKASGFKAGAISLIQPSNWDRMDEVLKFFHEEQIHDVRFNVMVPDGRAKNINSAPAKKLFQAKKTIFDFMLETKGKSVVDAALVNAMRRFVTFNGAPSCNKYYGCEGLYCQGGRWLYSVNPDGRFFACDRVAEEPSWEMGNVNNEFGPDELKHALKIRHAFHQKDDWWARCEFCDAKKICEFSCSAYYIRSIDVRTVECEYTNYLWDYFVERKDAIVSFLRDLSLQTCGDKNTVPKTDSNDFVASDLARSAFFNQLTSIRTVVANPKFQVFEDHGRFYLYVSRRNKIFEVDQMVADIARFNGLAGAEYIEQMLTPKYSAHILREAISNIGNAIPEVFQHPKQEKLSELAEGCVSSQKFCTNQERNNHNFGKEPV